MSLESCNPSLIKKVKETDTHVYFVSGPFSQWFKSSFAQKLAPVSYHIKFNCAEQYMMAGKALLFGDEETLEKILNVQQNNEPWYTVPERQKNLGKEVKNFSQPLWNREARRIVFRGSFGKFTQNDDLLNYIKNRIGKYIVEGAKYDGVWGVKLDWNDPAILDPAQWRGTNWLGQCIMATQAAIIHCERHSIPYHALDIWDNKLIDSFFS